MVGVCSQFKLCFWVVYLCCLQWRWMIILVCDPLLLFISLSIDNKVNGAAPASFTQTIYLTFSFYVFKCLLRTTSDSSPECKVLSPSSWGRSSRLCPSVGERCCAAVLLPVSAVVIFSPFELQRAAQLIKSHLFWFFFLSHAPSPMSFL